MKRSHRLVVGESQKLREWPYSLFTTVNDLLTGFRIKNVEVVGSLEHTHVFFDQIGILIEHWMHGMCP